MCIALTSFPTPMLNVGSVIGVPWAGTMTSPGPVTVQPAGALSLNPARGIV
jgi:hypothetical protein